MSDNATGSRSRKITIAKRPVSARSNGKSNGKPVVLARRPQAAAASSSANAPQSRQRGNDLSVYTADIDEALLDAVHGRHRLTVLKLEDRIVKFVTPTRSKSTKGNGNGNKKPSPTLEFESLPPFQRLLVHRLADRFHLGHEAVVDYDAAVAAGVDPTGPAVNLDSFRTIVQLSRTPQTKVPEALLVKIAQVRAWWWWQWWWQLLLVEAVIIVVVVLSLIHI